MTATTASPATATGQDPSTNKGSGRSVPRTNALNDIRVLVWRNLVKVVRSPQLLFFSLVQPVIFLTLFSQVFSGIAKTPQFVAQFGNLSYINYLLPATIVTTVAMNAANSGQGMATDLATGMVDRLRSMPISRSSVLFARSFSDLIRAGIQGLLMIVVGMAIFGFRFQGTLAEAVAMFIIVLPLNWALSWVYIALGVGTKNPETTQLVGFMISIPLMFVSSAYVPIDQLPGWLQGFAQVNPLSKTIDAARALALGMPVGDSVWRALISSAVVAAIGIPLAMWAWRKAFD